MATSGNPQLEHRALHLFRELLDREPAQRAEALVPLEPALRERVQALLAHMAEDDLEPSTDGPDVAGQRIGPYVLLERLGHGGMGEVFLAQRADGAFERQVAVKRIWAGHAPLAARFVRERQLLARLQHPHIAQLLDGGIDDTGKPWLAMELVRGQDIVRWCDERQAPLARRVELLCQVCDAVDHAHRQLIVHRDIKPSNILVDNDGHARLLDFGIARLLEDSDGEHTQTQAMTPAWATPEQRLGQPTTTASDVYQLGLLARVLLSGLPRTDASVRMSTGQARLYRDDPQHAATLARNRALPAPALQRQLRGDLDSIVALATADDAGARYPSARALADDLQRWLRGQPVQARAEERGYRLRRHARRWWPALAAGVVALGLLGYHVHSLQAALERTDRERQRAQRAEQQALSAQALAEQRRTTAGAVSDYFIRMFSMLGPGAIDGKQPATVRQLLDTGTAGLDSVQASNERSPQALAAMWSALATVHVNLGDHARALEVADKAVAAARAAEELPALAEALRARSNALHWLGRTDEAFDNTRQAVALMGGDPARFGTLYAKLHCDLASDYHQRGELDAALRHSRTCVDGVRQWPYTVPSVGQVQALNNSGQIATDAGDLRLARDWLEDGLRLYPQLANPNPSTRVLLETNLAMLDLHEDHPDAALARLQTLLPQAREQFGPTHPRTTLVLDRLVTAHLARGDATAALVTARELLAADTAGYGAGHPAVMDAHGLLLVAALLGERQHEFADSLRQLTTRCTEDTLDARAALVKLACAYGRNDDASLPALDAALRNHRDVAPWMARIADQWRKQLHHP